MLKASAVEDVPDLPDSLDPTGTNDINPKNNPLEFENLNAVRSELMMYSWLAEKMGGDLTRSVHALTDFEATSVFISDKVANGLNAHKIAGEK